MSTARSAASRFSCHALSRSRRVGYVLGPKGRNPPFSLAGSERMGRLIDADWVAWSDKGHLAGGGLPSNTCQHPRANRFIIVKGENVVGRTLARERLCGSRNALHLPANPQEAARTRRAFTDAQVVTLMAAES